MVAQSLWITSHALKYVSPAIELAQQCDVYERGSHTWSHSPSEAMTHYSLAVVLSVVGTKHFTCGAATVSVGVNAALLIQL